VPPQAVELEEAGLGALMLEKDGGVEVQGVIPPGFGSAGPFWHFLKAL